MKRLEREDYERLSAGARELEKDRYGPKVLLTPEGRIIKLFRRKRRLSMNSLYPYARRFQRNAQRLQRYGVPTVQVEAVYRCPAIERDLVIYPLLDGSPLRQYLQTAGNGRTILGELAEFVARLHHKGIYFRSLHLGNILRHPEGELMLIDVADLRFLWLPMSPLGRARNFRHLFRYPQDLAIIRHYGLKRFLARYLLTSGISPWSAKVLLSRLTRRRTEGGSQ